VLKVPSSNEGGENRLVNQQLARSEQIWVIERIPQKGRKKKPVVQ